MPPRYLFGPVDRIFADQCLGPDRHTGRCIAFGPEPGTDLPIGPQDTWDAITARFPAGWQPDFIALQLAHTHIPRGLWDAAVPLIGLAGDWNLLWHHYRHCLPRCERVLTDRGGVERLAAAGMNHAAYFNLHGCRADEVDMPTHERPRDIDVLFVGNMQDAVQRERLPWIARLPALGERWNVVIRTATYGDAYRELLARSRIVFNRSIRGECNMRTFEAAGAGALLFQEADNREVHEFFEQQKEYVAYQDENLEVLLEFYLTHEAERRAIADAAKIKVQGYRYVDLWAQAVREIERDLPVLQEHIARRHRPAPRNELLGRVWQVLCSATPTDVHLAGDLEMSIAQSPADAELHGAWGLVKGHSAGGDRPGAAAAVEHFHAAVRHAPTDVMAALNRAEALATLEQIPGALAECRRALDHLESLSGLSTATRTTAHFPSRYDFFRVEWERAAWANAGDRGGEETAKRKLLSWRLHGLLARLTGSLAHRYEATLARPDLPATRAALAQALVKDGRLADAAAHFRRAIASNPFDRAAPRVLFDVLAQLGWNEEQDRLARVRRLLARAAPQIVLPEPWFAAVATAPPKSGDVRPTPAKDRQRVSLCMIVRNEETNLPDCLARVADLVDEIVVVDTGSTDHTKEIATRNGAKVFDFPWVDSFAAARNESLRHATGDWIFWLDADDRLEEPAREAIRRLFAGLGPEPAVYLMSITTKHGTNATLVEHARLFRNDPAVRWEYRVHEQILPAAQRVGWPIRRSGVAVRHDGYATEAGYQTKSNRNLRLLNLEYAERADDPLVLFNLGSLKLDTGQLDEAIPLLERSIERAPPGYSLLCKTYALLTCAYRQLGRAHDAIRVCQTGRSAMPREPELLFYEGLLLLETGQPAAAEASLRELLRLPAPSDMAGNDVGLQGYKARQNLAVSLRDQRRWSEAEAEWRLVLAERRDFAPAWLGLVSLLSSQGRWEDLEREAARLEADSQVREMARLVRSKMLLDRKDLGAAIILLEATIRQLPHALWPRLLLAETRWQQADDPVATEQALRDVLALDPNHLPSRGRLAQLANRVRRLEAKPTPSGSEGRGSGSAEV